MNEQKHTPGPWQAVKFDDEPDAVIIGPNGDERIAVLAGNEGNEPDCPNAHLIVAALLEALSELVKWCDVSGLSAVPGDGTEYSVIRDARAAIAKAKGETES